MIHFPLASRPDSTHAEMISSTIPMVGRVVRYGLDEAGGVAPEAGGLSAGFTPESGKTAGAMRKTFLTRCILSRLVDKLLGKEL